jgi:hypothetical protein
VFALSTSNTKGRNKTQARLQHEAKELQERRQAVLTLYQNQQELVDALGGELLDELRGVQNTLQADALVLAPPVEDCQRQVISQAAEIKQIKQTLEVLNAVHAEALSDISTRSGQQDAAVKLTSRFLVSTKTGPGTTNGFIIKKSLHHPRGCVHHSGAYHHSNLLFPSTVPSLNLTRMGPSTVLTLRSYSYGENWRNSTQWRIC